MIKGQESPDETPEETPKSLRDTLTDAFEEHAPEEPDETPEETSEQSIEATPAVETTETRVRDDKGRFVAKNIDQLPDEPVKPVATPEPVPVVETIPPPSSWKKDYHEKWGTLPAEVQKYINQRESEYAKGVSTYKSEYDQLRPLGEAVAPFIEDLRANNIDPAQWVHSLGNAHYLLVKGSPEQKLAMFQKLANEYQVPLQHLFQQGEDGKVYYNPSIPAYAPPQPDVRQLVQSEMQALYSQQQIQSFINEQDAGGNPKHPHYETVRETMAQLLDAGLADDLNSAYDTALRHPRHADIYDSIATQQKEAAEKARQEKIRAEAQRAKSNAVSVKGSTPRATTQPGSKGVRGAIEAAIDEHEGAGRI